jgi:DUF917 family protein
MSGGFIASCRNPLRASYVRKHAALGGISRALELGEAILAAEGRGGDAVIDAICSTTGGTVLATGRVARKSVAYTDQAFDVGTIVLDSGEGPLRLHVMNEYMAVDDPRGARLATFPDVITALDANGQPISVGDTEVGTEMRLLHIPKTLLPLSASVKDPSVYPVVEAALAIPIARYALS